jgi:IS5 family transposase
MKQMAFADAEYAGKRKQTRKELFLIEMDQVVPWKGLIALIEPHYPKGEGGRPATAIRRCKKRPTRPGSCASLPG